MANVRIPIADLVMDGGDGQDGLYIRGGGLEGLLDGADVRRQQVDRPGADGVFSQPSYLSPRLVAVGGDCVASSAERLDHWASRLKALQGIRGEFKVVFDMPGKTVWGNAHLSDRPSFKPTIWGVLAEWDLELQFADPRLFGESRTFTSAASAITYVHHYGNFPASPLLTITGTMASGYTIWGPSGRQFIVTAAVTAGVPHVIDMHAGTLSIGGAIVHGAVSKADTWGVPAGGTVEYQLVPVAGTGSLSIAVTDTYI